MSWQRMYVDGLMFVTWVVTVRQCPVFKSREGSNGGVC